MQAVRDFDPKPLVEIVRKYRPEDQQLCERLQRLTKAEFSESSERGLVYWYFFKSLPYDTPVDDFERIEIPWTRARIEIREHLPTREIVSVQIAWKTSDPKKTDIYVRW